MTEITEQDLKALDEDLNQELQKAFQEWMQALDDDIEYQEAVSND